MKVTAAKFNEYLAQFVAGDLIPNARNLTTKFALGFLAGTDRLRVDNLVPTLRAMGVSDDEGNIDMDALKKGAYAGLNASGELRIDAIGISLERPEFDRFFRLVETGALN